MSKEKIDYVEQEVFDLPDGWTCIKCGDEYLNDTEGKCVDSYTEGTLCKKCNQEEVTS
jgi:hypothetical protein